MNTSQICAFALKNPIEYILEHSYVPRIVTIKNAETSSCVSYKLSSFKDNDGNIIKYIYIAMGESGIEWQKMGIMFNGDEYRQSKLSELKGSVEERFFIAMVGKLKAGKMPSHYEFFTSTMQISVSAKKISNFRASNFLSNQGRVDLKK